MQKTIETLYRGYIEPAARFLPSSEEYRRARRRSVKMEKRFLRELSPKQQRAYEIFFNAHLEVVSFESMQSFVEGFRLGGALMLDILSE